MSTHEQPETPPLTRKQLREIRNTGANPVIDTGALAVMAAEETAAATEETDAAPVAPPPFEASLTPVSPLPRPAEPVVLPEPPGPDRGVDLGVSPLTRRQARQQERIRTASVPVITPDVASAYESASSSVPPVIPPLVDSVPEAPGEDEAEIDPFAALGVDPDADGEDSDGGDAAEDSAEHGSDDSPEEPSHEDEPGEEPDARVESSQGDESHGDESIEERPDEEHPADAAPEEHRDEAAADVTDAPDSDADSRQTDSSHGTPDEPAEDETPRVVDPGFGAALLAGGSQPAEPLPPSFDDLIARSSSGSVATPNALILSQSPNGGPIVAPVNATGEVLITGTFNLPEGLGSTGHAPGTADGKEVDAVLVDGELPAHSSPTPIAASAAISTAKAPGEIIKPPAPEKGGRLMLTLAITAGVLALALVGVLILAFTTGVF